MALVAPRRLSRYQSCPASPSCHEHMSKRFVQSAKSLHHVCVCRSILIHPRTAAGSCVYCTRFIENGTTVAVPTTFVLGIPRDAFGGRWFSPCINLVRPVGHAKDGRTDGRTSTRHDTIVHHSAKSFDVVIRLALGMVFILDQVLGRFTTHSDQSRPVRAAIDPAPPECGWQHHQRRQCRQIRFQLVCIIRPLANSQTVQTFVEARPGPRRARLDRSRRLCERLSPTENVYRAKQRERG